MKSESWRRSVLSEVVEEHGGLQTGPFGSQLHASDYVAQGIPVLMPRDLAGNVISDAGAARVLSDKASDLARYRLRAGDIILARRGKIGRCALVTAAEEGWLCGTGCLRIRPASVVSSSFLLQLLQWHRTVDWLKANAVGQTMPNLSMKILSQLPIQLPPLAVQERIAKILDSVDTTISATRRVIEQTATVKRGFLNHLLIYGTAAKTRGDSARRQTELPPGWKLRPIGDLCTFTNGHGFRATEWSTTGLPIIRIQNLNGSRDFKYFAGTPKESCQVEPGELLFAWAGVKGVSFGPRLWDGPPGVLNQHIYRVRPLQKVAKPWLFETLRRVTRSIEGRAQGFKSSLQHVRKADITDHIVTVPPYEEQCAIADRSAFLVEMETIEQTNLEGLIKMKRALMSDLFSGHVDVPLQTRRDVSEELA